MNCINIEELKNNELTYRGYSFEIYGCSSGCLSNSLG
nr:MAG TPA: hypothetical protein [Caudoviricetes sp.]DAY09390.1 MAG TPA: hypothetical protein [Caudoviricetes sp.]